jgi:undecaprenyl-diphosphatase
MGFPEIDRELFFLINHGTSNTIFDNIMPLITSRGYLLLLFYPIYLLISAYRERQTSARDAAIFAALLAISVSVLSFLLTDWIANDIKNLIGRERPCNALDGVRVLVGCTQSKSMPSNHASNAFAAAVPLIYLSRGHISRAWLLYPLLIAMLISFSRVYVGVHYPADIAVGGLLGSLIACVLLLLTAVTRKLYERRPNTAMFIVGLAAISFFRVYYILHGPLDLSPDEAHYWEWSRRLDWSYYSKGPMIAYLIYAGTALFGDTIFGIRIMAVIFSVLSSVYLFKLVNIMYGSHRVIYETGVASYQETREGLVASMLLQITLLFAPFGIIFSIDSPFIFFWVLSLYLFRRAIDTDRENSLQEHYRWLLLGVSIGLGLLTKYTMVFFYIAGFLFLLFSSRRPLLKRSGPYLAVVLSIIVFSPVIIWNIQHDWVTVRHTAGQAHLAKGLSLSVPSFLEFFASQIGVVTPLLFGLMLYSLVAGRTRQNRDNHLFLICFSLSVLLFFLLKSIQGKVQANWAMHGYITGIVAFSHHYFGTGSDERHIKGKVSLWLAVSAIAFTFLMTALSHYPAVVKLSPTLDPSARLRGWRQLETEANKIYNNLIEKGHVFVFSDSYQVASELAFYIKKHPVTYAVNLGRRMNQYDLWPDMNTDARKIRSSGDSAPAQTINGIFVKMGREDMPVELANSFESYERKVLEVYEREYLLREYSIFICYNFKGLQIETPKTY